MRDSKGARSRDDVASEGEGGNGHSEVDEATGAWSRVCQGLVRRYPLARVSKRQIRFVLLVRATRVGIRVTPLDVDRSEIAQVSADLGPIINVDPWDALQFNALLSEGALAVVGKTLLLCTTVRYADLDDALLDQQVQRLAAEAAEIKRRFGEGSTTGDLTAYLHYCE